MNALGEKYISRHLNSWRFEVTVKFRTVKHSYAKLFKDKTDALNYRDQWIARTHWLALGAVARAKILINGGARALEKLDTQPKRTNNQTYMDSGYIYVQLIRLENGWANNLKRISRLEAQLSALVERIYNIERKIDAINARRNARARAAAKKQQQNDES